MVDIMSKADVVEIEGVVVEKLPNAMFQVELENGHTIGMVILSDINYKTRTAGLAFKRYASKEYRMKDDMYNACIALLRYAFDELGLNCITTRTLTYNDKSLNLQNRLGFKQEGVLRQRCFKNGKYQDLISSSLLKNEFNG